MANAEHLMTAAEVAQRFNVHPETIRRWARKGELPAVRVNRKVVRYRPSDVEALLSGQASA
jgi:excisionase family DNA binding protein